MHYLCTFIISLAIYKCGEHLSSLSLLEACRGSGSTGSWRLVEVRAVRFIYTKPNCKLVDDRGARLVSRKACWRCLQVREVRFGCSKACWRLPFVNRKAYMKPAEVRREGSDLPQNVLDFTRCSGSPF